MQSNIHIWDPDTGIQDLLDEELNSFSIVSGIRDEWSDLYDLLNERGEVKKFCLPRTILAAVETGQIEGLYDVDERTKTTLISEGLDSPVLTNNVDLSERALNLIKDQKATIEGVFDIVAEQIPLTINLIKQIHQKITQHQDYTEGVDKQGNVLQRPLLKGEWKKHPNNVMRDGVLYEYCPPLHVQSEMEKLLAIHYRHEEEGVSGEISAAWLHHRFTQIHPFHDGNGRVARILASIVLLKNRLFPLVVQREDKEEYIKALEVADGEVFTVGEDRWFQHPNQRPGSLHKLISTFIFLQDAEREASRKTLLSMPDCEEVAISLSQKRKEMIVNTPVVKVHDVLAQVDPMILQVTDRMLEVVSSALSSKELNSRGLDITVSSKVVKTLAQCFIEKSRSNYSATLELGYPCVSRVIATQAARQKMLTMGLYVHYDALQRELICSTAFTSADALIDELDNFSRPLRDFPISKVSISFYDKDDYKQLEETRGHLQHLSKQSTTSFIIEALAKFFPGNEHNTLW